MKPFVLIHPRLKFAFLIFKYFPYGGVQRDMLRIAQDCAEKGHEVTVYTGQWRGEWPTGSVNVVLLKSVGLLNHQRHQSLINAMHAAVKADKPDLVLGFNRMPGLDAYYAADPCFIERAHKERGWFYRLSGRYRFFARSERAVMHVEGNCRILLLTPRERRVFQQWYCTPDERFFQIPPSIPSGRFAGIDRAVSRIALRKEFLLPADSDVILHVGSAFLRKGLDRAIQGLANLPIHLRQKSWLLAVGEDDAESMQRLARQLGVADHVIITQGRSDVPELMMGSDLLVHPARSELAGIVIIEALTAGLPVIVTDVCGYAQHVTLSCAGKVLSSPYRQKDFDAALEEMIATKDRKPWQLAGQAYVNNINANNSRTFEADLLEQFAHEKRGML